MLTLRMLKNELFKNKKKTSIVFVLPILSAFILVSCGPKRVMNNAYSFGKRGYYYLANKKASTQKADLKNTYINTNISSLTMEESIFLEDLQFKFINQNGKVVPVGRKFYAKNPIITTILPFDRIDLMGEIGRCRAKQTDLRADLADDGKINGSVKDQCLDRRKTFTIGKIRFTESSYTMLEDWHGDDFKDALYTFLQSCKGFNGEKEVASKTFSIGTTADWREICSVAVQYYKAGYAKMFFERYFSPYQITDKSGVDNSKFTGYYIWELPVSLTRSDKYWYPIYSLPQQCKKNMSCPSRNEINGGALSGQGLEIAWASNPMDVYFMQVQGSGVGILENGQSIRFNYAGKNNQKFRSYSDYIKKHKGFCPVKGYYETINWLNQNPSKALEATSVCDSYVFFSKKSGLDPVVGSQGTPLVQSRSIAIDPNYIPYGVPMWIQTHLAIVDTDNHDDDQWVDWNRLYIAQDTGSAIKGVVRADLYMGHGKKGEFIAKNQNFSGTWFMLIPNSLVGKVR